MRPNNWTVAGRQKANANRRELQALNDEWCVEAIRDARARGLSWRQTASHLDVLGVPTPRRTREARYKQTRAYQANLAEHWTHTQVTRIARRHGIQ